MNPTVLVRSSARRRRNRAQPSPDVPRARHRSLLRRNLRFCFWDGVLFSLMVGAGETYLPAFTLAMGFGAVVAGLITTAPLAVGAVLQLVSPSGVQWLGSHRRWVVLCSLAQASSFVPLAIGSACGSMPLALLFLAATVYWGAGLATNGAWNSWIETIVPRRLRARYFARRTRYAQLGVLLGFVAGGCVLYFAKQHGSSLFAFAGLFVAAALFRVLSACCLAGQSEPKLPEASAQRLSARDLFARARHSGDGRLLVYLFAVQTAAQLAGPYFTPYMLGEKNLNLDYASYVALIGMSFLSKAVALPLLGAVAQRRGAYRLLWLAGIGIVPLSSLWIVSQNYVYLLGVQILAGLMWAGYELAMFLLFFEAIPRRERTSLLTIYNLGNSLATVVGSLLGAALLNWGGNATNVYFLVFGLSGVGRALALVFLARVPNVSIATHAVATRTLGVSAGDSVLEQPILSSLDDERE